MTLEVPFEGFAEAVKRHASGGLVFVMHENGGTRVTVADPVKSVRVLTYAPQDPPVVSERLREQGLQVAEGRWLPDDAPAASGEVYVAAVAYRTDGTQPGLWVDGFPEPPTAVQAIRAMYDEFQSTGEAADVSFEEFMRLAEPTVVLLSPGDLRGFAIAKDC